MSREIAGTNSAPLTSELFQTSVYKPNQGRIVRQLTALAIWVISALGCWALYSTLRGNLESGSYLVPVIPGVLLMAGAWFGYRVVNWPRFADFLIAVEAEMNKVTWPSKDELVRASIVVIFTIFFLAISLFLFDILWQQVFTMLGVTS
ncbi:MAG: preprotein translocase subunit SecE [Rubripirellula sp.]